MVRVGEVELDGALSTIYLYMDAESYVWLKGSTIDFHEELSRALFVVNDNPNAENACGCKSSFAPKNSNNKHLFEDSSKH